MRVSGATKLLGIIGQNISYTQSPALHNSAIDLFGLDQIYVPFDVSETVLAELLKVSWDMGAVGFNVTKPHKGRVATLVKSPLKSVNTLFRGPQGWQAASTDGHGFCKALERVQVGATHAAWNHIVFLGNGGAVASILEYMHETGMQPKTIHFLTRTTQDLAWERGLFPQAKIEWAKLEPGELTHCLQPQALLIQATSAPQQADDMAAFVPAVAHFRGVFVDLCYGIKVSALLAACRKMGLPTQDGLPMLVEQARKAQELWWGRSLSYEQLEAQFKP